MYTRILAVVAVATESQGAVREAVALARLHGSEVHFFALLPQYVPPFADTPELGGYSQEEFKREVNEHAERVLNAARQEADSAGVQSAAMKSDSDTAQSVLNAAESGRCDLIVVEAGTQNAVMRLIGGSVIPGLITSAKVPVLVCRGARVAA